jgi:hypothetical protein
MLRLGCVVALLGLLACDKTDASSGSLGSPNASVAGREAEKKPSARAAGTSKAGDTNALARSLIAVAATSYSDAQPCERVCGRVGDCLLEDGEDGEISEFEAGRLELECLDMCVHSPKGSGPRSAFLACENQLGCGPLLGCARSNWDALVATRSGPSVQGITTGGDSCDDGCRWYLSCMITGLPPGQAQLAPEYEEAIRSCEVQCETIQPAERESFTHITDCIKDNCSHDRQSVCYEHF